MWSSVGLVGLMTTLGLLPRWNAPASDGLQSAVAADVSWLGPTDVEVRRLDQLTETKAECRQALIEMEAYVTGDASAWDRLDRLSDPLARAFVGFEHYRAGRLGRAERSREVLIEHALARTAEASLLVQHIQLVRGTFAHCSDDTLTTVDGNYSFEVPTALCWPFQIAPAAAVEAFGDEPEYHTDWMPKACQKRLAKSPATAPAATAIARAMKGLPQRPSRWSKPSCVDHYVGLGVSQDFGRAYRCALERQDTKLELLLLLNGQGTPRALARAQHVLLAGVYWRHLSPALASFVDRRIAEPEQALPLGYCDFALMTVEINECSWLQARLAEQAENALRHGVRSRFTRKQQALLDEIHVLFLGRRAALEKLEEIWSFRGTGQSGFVANVREAKERRYTEHIQRWLVRRSFSEATASPEHVAELEQASAVVISEQRANAPKLERNEAWRPAPSPPPDPETARYEREWAEAHAEAYRQFPGALERAIASSTRAIDVWVRLAASVAPRPLRPEAVEQTVRATLLHDQANDFGGSADLPSYWTAY